MIKELYTYNKYTHICNTYICIIYREREERERGERETECWGSQVHNTDTMSRSQLCPDTITERDSIPPSSSGTSSKRNQQ